MDKSEVFQFAFGIVKEMVLILGRAGFLELVAEDTLQKPIPLAKVVTIVRILAIEFASDIGNIAITRNSGLSTTENVMWSRMMRPTLAGDCIASFYYAQTVPGGYHATVDDARLFGDFCSIEALERLGR